MFTEILEYKAVIEKIEKELSLTENQFNKIIKIITENPKIKSNDFYNLVEKISKNEKIIMDKYFEYTTEPILNENQEINLIEIALPIIMKHIPEQLYKILTENQARIIVDKIMNLEINEQETTNSLSQRIDEMFLAGNITIPIQGLRTKPVTMEIITNGLFAPLLYKGIKFNNKEIKRKDPTAKLVLKDILKGYNVIKNNETPISVLLPQIFLSLKKITNKGYKK